MTKEEYIKAFTEGVQWWEFEQSGFTLWRGAQVLAEDEAGKRWKRGKVEIGIIEHNGNSE